MLVRAILFTKQDITFFIIIIKTDFKNILQHIVWYACIIIITNHVVFLLYGMGNSECIRNLGNLEHPPTHPYTFWNHYLYTASAICTGKVILQAIFIQPVYWAKHLITALNTELCLHF